MGTPPARLTSTCLEVWGAPRHCPRDPRRTAERTAQPGRPDGVLRRPTTDTAVVVRALPRSPLLRVVELWLLAVAPVILLVGAVRSWAHSHTLAYDFDRAYLPAAHLVLHGSSPYGPATRAALGSQTAFVYPPIGAFLAVPFAAVPAHAADILVTVLAAFAVPAILALLGVRDWRCLGASLLWMPTVSAIHLGTVTVVLVFGVALAWRWRDHAVRAGLVLGLVVAVKLFLWPLVVWLAITKRFRATGVAVASAAFLFLVPWIPLDGAGLGSYPHRLSLLSSLEAKRGFSPAALLSHLGVGWGAAQAIGYALGVALLVLAYRRRSSETVALNLACAASLLLTPILWPNYLLIMLVPLALHRPRFSLVWLLPVVLIGQPVIDPAAWEIAVFLAILAVLTADGLGAIPLRRPQPVLA
jgi:Glycosyltransferase family 87